MNRIAITGILTVALAGLVACGGGVEKRETGPAVKVSAAPAAMQKMPSLDAFVGNVKSRKAVTISTKMMGRVQRILVDEGQAVQKGQVLLEVDAAEAKSGAEQSRSGLAAADVAVGNAEKDRDRFQRLYEQKAVTKHQLEQVEMGLAAAKAQQASARAGLELSETLLSYGKIVAPDSGVITKKWMDAGNLAYPGAPILTLENTADLEISVSVPEERAGRLAAGQKAEVTVDSVGKTLDAMISSVVPAADPATRTSAVKLLLPSDAGLKPGQFAQVRFDAFSQEALVVPLTALKREGQMDGVFVAENGVARLRWIQVGQRGEAFAQVLSGLKAGESVINPLPAGLSDGSPVEVSR